MNLARAGILAVALATEAAAGATNVPRPRRRSVRRLPSAPLRCAPPSPGASSAPTLTRAQASCAGSAPSRSALISASVWPYWSQASSSSPRKESPSETPSPEPVSAQAEGLLYYALVGAIEVGLVRAAEDALTVLRQASQPLGPMGAAWLAQQERRLDQA